METIRNYLENMFMQLPNTPEVKQAKRELSQMMEDKYNELISEGSSENEAVGTVISEFGNLDELSEALGISGYVHTAKSAGVRMVSQAEARDYIKDMTLLSLLTGIIAFLGINCADMIIAAGAWGAFRSGSVTRFSLLAGFLFLGLCIAGIIGISVFKSNIADKWRYIEDEACMAEMSAVDYADDQREYNRSFDLMLKTLGIICCAVCFLPVVVLGMANQVFLAAFGVVIMLVLIGAGVVMIVFSSGRQHACERILALNTSEKIRELSGSAVLGGEFTDSQRELRSATPFIRAFASLYWPTITCVYLSYSFLTFRWGTSWLIWPVAAVVAKLLTNLTGVEVGEN